MSTTREVNLAPNISQVLRDGVLVGHRVYIRAPDPATGKSRKYAERLGPELTLAQLIAYRDAAALAALAPPEDPTGFTADARRYLQLAAVQHMPSIPARTREIEAWIRIFGDQARDTIDTNAINDALYRLKGEGYANSSVNKFRTALMSLWTTLDGRSARNPVRDSIMFQEADLTARGQDEALLVRILGAIADTVPARWRLEVLYRTGMDPLQLARMNPATDLSLVGAGWYAPPYRQKGKRVTRTPRIPVRLPLTPAARTAFQRLLALKAFGPFNGASLLHTWLRAQRRVERELRKEYDDPAFVLPHIRIKDLRHSFGTDLYARSNGDESYVAQMLMHAPGSPMTRRYSLGAVPSVLREKSEKFAGESLASGTASRGPRGPKVVPLQRKR